jgi:hypothetical protein
MNVRQESKNQQIEFSIEIAITKRNLECTFKIYCNIKQKNNYAVWVWPCFQQNNGTSHQKRRFPYDYTI